MAIARLTQTRLTQTRATETHAARRANAPWLGRARGRLQARRLVRAGIVGIALMLGACASEDTPNLAESLPSLPQMPKFNDINPFATKETPMPGKRVPIVASAEKLPGEFSAADRPIVVPAPHANESWTQPGGDAGNAPGNLAIGATIKQSWSADAGSGSNSYGRLTASPVVYENRAFTLDANAKVSAFATNGGSAIWRVSLKPETQKGYGGYGGGLAVDGGRLYAATGFGVVAAMDPATGKKIWEKSLGVPVRASPTAAAERVFVLTTEGQVVCLNGTDGSEMWTYRGLPQRASLVSNPSPAIDGDTVVVPYPSGDIVALRISSGQTLWTDSLSRNAGEAGLAAVTDAARPAIVSGIVYAVGAGGRMIATQAKSGQRAWAINVASAQPPTVAGDVVYVVDIGGQLIAVGRLDGKIVWTIKLPQAAAWSGPTMAGGTLWLTSNTGKLVGVDGATGKLGAQLDLGATIYIAPVVAQGRMFVMTDKAKLIAFN